MQPVRLEHSRRHYCSLITHSRQDLFHRYGAALAAPSKAGGYGMKRQRIWAPYISGICMPFCGLKQSMHLDGNSCSYGIKSRGNRLNNSSGMC